jgi:hypothetical protein
MDLPVGWASVPLSSALRDRGFVFQAMNKTIDAGLLLSVAARKSITDPSEFAVTRRTSQVVALSDATYSDIHRTRVNGMNAWQFEVSGTSTLLRPGKQLTFEVTLVEGKKEIVEIKTWMYAAGIEGHKQELLNTARSIRGM